MDAIEHYDTVDVFMDQITQTSNRIRGLPTQIHPALERVLGRDLIPLLCTICYSDTLHLLALPPHAKKVWQIH